MSTLTVTTRLTEDDVCVALAGLPAAIGGGDARLSEMVLTPLGTRTLDLIAERFDALGVPGGTYAPTGEQWADNSPVTVRLKRGHARTVTGRRLAGRGYQNYAIGVDTGDMRQALEPADGGGPSGHPQQVFRFEGGKVVVGLKTPPDYPVKFATGDGDRQPARPLLPDGFPDAWNQSLGETAAQAIGEAIVAMLGVG